MSLVKSLQHRSMILEKIAELALESLYQDGSHHKQWYLEQILMLSTGHDLKHIQDTLPSEYEYIWDEGIAP